MAELNSNKYLDLIGLAKFWERVKDVILHSIVTVREGVKGATGMGEAGTNTYIKIYEDSTSVTADGGQKYIYTVDETPLVEKIDDMDATIATETAERKADIALLAGKSWNTDKHTWDATKPVTHSNITDISAALVDHASKIQSLVQATEFVGVVDWDPEKATIEKDSANPIQSFKVKIGGTLKGTYRAGDIIVYNTKEYILDGDVNNGYSKPEFRELGDVTEEAERLTDIEAWINTPISFDDISDVFNGNIDISKITKYPQS